MASSYTTLLGFNKPALGDAGWGTSVNGGFTDLVEQALTGAYSVAVVSGGTTTLPAIATGTASNARNQFLTITGSLTSVQTATVIVPAGVSTNFKFYIVSNVAGGTVTVATAAGTSVAIPTGRSMTLRVTNNGVEETQTYAASMTLGTALAATSGGTGQASYAVGDLLYASSTTALSKLTVGATNAILTVAAGVPAWTTTLGIASGGTGQTTALAAFDALKQAATDAYTGVVELATNAEALAGTDTVRPVTPAAMRAGFSASGSAPVFAARAWVNFNGTGVVAIRSSGNVTSITDNGTGDYTVNFTTALSDANYAVAATGSALVSPGSSGYNVVQINETGTPYNTASIRVGSVTQSGGTPTNYDSTYVNVVVYR